MQHFNTHHGIVTINDITSWGGRTTPVNDIIKANKFLDKLVNSMRLTRLLNQRTDLFPEKGGPQKGASVAGTRDSLISDSSSSEI